MKNASSSARLLFCAFVVLIGGSFVGAVPEAESPSHSETQPETQAAAQLQRIFVASYGKDANSGSRGAPKRTFQAAHDAVAANGEIVVIDTAVYGPINISKGLSVIAPPGVNGIISVSGSAHGIFIINSPSNIGVILRGLVIEGGGQGATGSGIYSLKGLYLVVEDCSFRNFHTAVQQLTPGSSTSLNNTVVLGCYLGLQLDMASGGDASAYVSRCRFELNGSLCLSAQNSAPGAALLVTVADSTFYRNQSGIAATLFNGSSSQCNVLVSNSIITNNGTGVVGVGASNNGQILSRGNNTLMYNANGNSFSGTYGAK